MRRLCYEILGAIFVLVMAASAGFAAQQQSQTQTQQQPQAQSQQQPAATDTSQQPDASQDQTATSDEDSTVKGVKPGSEKRRQFRWEPRRWQGREFVFPAARDRARQAGGHGSGKDRQD